MRKKIGELLIESGVVTEEQVRKALGQQRAFGHGQRLGSVLVHLGHASRAAVSRALARQCNLPFLELPEIAPEVSKIISLDFQAEHRVVSFRLEKEGRSERLSVAVEDPTDLSVVDELRFHLNKPIRVFVAAPDDIDRALELARGGGDELDVVETISLDEDDGVELEIEYGSAGMPTPPPPPVDAVLLDWELPPALEDDNDVTPPTPRSTLKPSVPPPAPPPDLDDEDGGDITLITPLSALKPKPTAAPVRPPPPPAQESEELLEELLGEPEPEPAASGKPRVPVVVFGGAAQGLPQPPPPPEPPDFSDADLKVLEDIERLAAGGEAVLDTEKVKPARMVASLIRLLLRKRIIHEEEFLEELSRK